GIAAVPQSKRGVEALKDIARVEQDNGKPLIENRGFAEKIADLEIQVTALEFTELRVLSQMAHGGKPGPEVSGLKVRGSEIQQSIAELTMEAVGEYSAPYLPGLLWQGSNEGPVGPEYARLAGLGRDAALPVRERTGGRGGAAHHPVRRQDGRAGDLHLRQRRAEGTLPARHPQLRRAVVPGLLRAGCGLRPRQPAHAGGA